MERESTGKVSCREYYSYKLQIRQNSQCTLLLAGRLLQQYVVDMYIKLETTRLDYYRRQQSKLRAELYQGIVDSITAGETRGNQVGQRIVLPASFVGGPRDMRRRYLDAMAMVQHYGKPDIFLTMTCNPEWNEIKDELKEGQLAQDRPDLTSRVFRAKLHDLKDQLFKKEIFGKVAAHVHVIEFQKRGLPHVHMLLIMKPGYKMTTPDEYDKFISAEIPDEREYPLLHEVVVKHMMHGPCGELNKNNSCMVDGECKNHYPRRFCSKTMQGNDAYPLYRRRDDKRQVQVRNKMLDNRWVVPHNPYLLTRYNCHFNVEICSGLKAVKYLYKYIYKGHDRVAVHIAFGDGENVVDEIQQFQDARWVSAQESMWRIYEFNLNEMYPAVTNLQLHLPNKQSVYYWETQNLEQVILWDHNMKTTLTEYFRTCSTDIEARKYLYREFPEHYVWNKQGKCWTRRKKGEVIGRVNGANPMEGERYYLRILLNHVRGPTSFKDLLTVEGIRYLSFKESAQKRGLLESDESISECLNEAATFQLPQALRRLFATILVYCEPSDVRKLWDDHFEAMSEDFNKIYPDQQTIHVSCTLESINTFLESMGKSISDYDLPTITIADNSSLTNQRSRNSREIRDELSIETPPEDYSAPHNFNPEQESAYTTILNRVNSGRSGVFFVDGPGGTGKTYLYRALLANMRARGMIALATATSGVAAAIMPGGRTAHSRFKIPILTTETSLCNISKQSATADLMRKAKLIVWDEAPMAKRFAIETLDRSLKDILNNNELFGGKVIVLGGDFRQVLPVVRQGTRAETVNASLVRSHLWNNMHILSLTKNMRARTDPNFSNFLLRVGNGDEQLDSDGMISLPDEMVIKWDNDEASEHNLINAIFPALQENARSAKYMTERAILATTNEHVDKLNEKLITVFPGPSTTFNSFDEAVDDTNNYYQEEFLNSLMPNGLPPHKLTLKENCPIMLLRNLDPSNGLCNGTRMVCRGYVQNVIHAEITNGQHSGKHVFLPRIPLSPAENEGYPFQFKRKQFPIRLCFAMTINKAQGQTIPYVGVYLPQHVFSHGQLYVALSRGISMSTTKVLVKPENKRRVSHTKNIVYKEVLSHHR